MAGNSGLNRPGYKSELYKSITTWDSRPDLWRDWQRLFTARSDPDNVETAEAFFAENETAMMEGVQVFWPSKEPYVKLQEKLLTLGRSAFFKEKMNSPIKDGDQIFDTSLWTRFISPDGHIQTITQGLTLEENPDSQEWDRHSCLSSNPSSRSDTTIRNSELVIRNSSTPTHYKDQLKYFGFLDPAMGKATTRDGDYAAIVTVGKAPDNTLYVMNVWMEKASPMKQVEQVFALHQKFRYEKFGFECNGFQETLGTFIRDEQTKLKTGGDHWHLPIEKHNNHHSKHSRISLLEPHILAGSILFQQDLSHEFYIQADEYNGSRSNHDDGLDALASCVEMIRTSEKNIRHIKSIKRKTPIF